ncbi:MAG TPA: hypothetical protein VGF40_20470 [Thermoanaerobaculia bacterium]
MKIVAPVRATRTFSQRYGASPDRVFPYLCPVREAEWVEGWDPSIVVSASGIAERDCVFITQGPEAIWIVTEYEPPRRIEFVKVTPGLTVARITIVLSGAGEHETQAEVTYSHTAIAEAGERFVEGFTGEFYEAFMKEWEAALSARLAT